MWWPSGALAFFGVHALNLQFYDWQTRRSYMNPRIFFSTSLLPFRTHVAIIRVLRNTYTPVRKVTSESNIPWFMKEQTALHEDHSATADNLPQNDNQILPEALPEHLITLHRHLAQSPLLARSALRICKPSSLQNRAANDDLSLAYSRPKGRRRRGVSDAGESVGEPDDLWSWYVLAQVKEGTEGRGAIEAVIRNAQKEVYRFIRTNLDP